MTLVAAALLLIGVGRKSDLRRTPSGGLLLSLGISSFLMGIFAIVQTFQNWISAQHGFTGEACRWVQRGWGWERPGKKGG